MTKEDTHNNSNKELENFRIMTTYQLVEHSIFLTTLLDIGHISEGRHSDMLGHIYQVIDEREALVLEEKRAITKEEYIQRVKLGHRQCHNGQAKII